MKKGWEIKTLGEVCDVINGLWTGKTPPYINVGVIRNTNFTKDCKLNDDDIAYLDVEIKQYQKRKLQYGDLIIEKSGGGPKQPVGRAIIFNKQEGEFSFSNFTSALRINKEIVDFRFVHKVLLYKYLNGETEKMQSHTIGIRNLDFKLYKEISIPIPPIKEQEEIVEKLDKGFELIDSLKETAKKNLDNAKELFQSVLREELSPKEGWKTKTLGEVCDFVRGLTYSKNDEVNYSNNAVLRSNNIDPISLKLNLNEIKYINDSIQIAQDKIVQEGTIMICTANGSKSHLGKVAYIDKNYGYAFGGFMGLLKPKESVIPIYLYYSLITPIYKDYISKLSDGVNINNLKFSDLSIYSIPIPPIQEQDEIVERLDLIKGKCEMLEGNYKRVLELCEELKQGLLREAFEVR